jgi:hypothetical protein
MYQWDKWVIGDRMTNSRPCLTINKTQQHNLQIINDGKQNKPGVTIRPVGGDASFEAAQVFQEVVRHIEYISNAENVYDYAAQFQVNAGWGYWRVVIEPIADDSFDKEIFIRRIKDPRSVYILILLLMKLTVLMLVLDLSLMICRKIYMKLLILNLKM